MKNLLMFLSIGFISIISFGQNNTLVAGGTAAGTGGSATYSVGQIDYERRRTHVYS